MKYITWIFTTLLLATPLSHAGSLIECQDNNGQTFLQLRAEKRVIKGEPSFEKGGWWMQYREKMYPGPLGDTSTGSKVTAESPNKTDTDITIQQAIAATGPVGQKIRLRGLDTETPSVWTVTFGGFVGYLEMGPFRCTKITNPCSKALSTP